MLRLELEDQLVETHSSRGLPPVCQWPQSHVFQPVSERDPSSSELVEVAICGTRLAGLGATATTPNPMGVLLLSESGVSSGAGIVCHYEHHDGSSCSSVKPAMAAHALCWNSIQQCKGHPAAVMQRADAVMHCYVMNSSHAVHSVQTRYYPEQLFKVQAHVQTTKHSRNAS